MYSPEIGIKCWQSLTLSLSISFLTRTHIHSNIRARTHTYRFSFFSLCLTLFKYTDIYSFVLQLIVNTYLQHHSRLYSLFFFCLCERISCARVHIVPKRASNWYKSWHGYKMKYKHKMCLCVCFIVFMYAWHTLTESEQMDIRIGFSNTLSHTNTTTLSDRSERSYGSAFTEFKFVSRAKHTHTYSLTYFIIRWSERRRANQNCEESDRASERVNGEKKKWSKGKMLTRRKCIYFNVVCASLSIIRID